MSDLTNLPNVGEVLASKLEAIGVKNYNDLVNLGSVEAILKIKEKFGPDGGCYSMLYALEGAIQGVRWHDLGKEKREKLKQELKKALET